LLKKNYSGQVGWVGCLDNLEIRLNLAQLELELGKMATPYLPPTPIPTSKMAGGNQLFSTKGGYPFVENSFPR